MSSRAPRADLADLIADPGRVTTLSPEQIPAVLCQLSGLQTALAARLAEFHRDSDRESNEPDSLLDVAEAAERLGVSRDWLYRNQRRLSFTVRVGPRHLRFSSKGIERYIRQRQAR